MIIQNENVSLLPLSSWRRYPMMLGGYGDKNLGFNEDRQHVFAVDDTNIDVVL